MEGKRERERAVREKESFLLKSIDGKSTPLLRSAPDRAEPPPGRTTPSLAPDTANDAIPAPRPRQIRAEPPARAPREASACVGGGVAGEILPRERAVLRRKRGWSGATCAAEVEGSVAWHCQCMGMGEGKRPSTSRVGPCGSACGVVFPVRPRRRWQRDGDVSWGRRRSRTNGWERAPGHPLRPRASTSSLVYAAGSLFFLLVFLCEHVKGRLVKKIKER